MENWPQFLILGGILLIGIASFGFSVSQAVAPGQAMSDTEAFQILVAVLGFALVVGGMWKK
jgi:hypothetical protein